MGATTGAATCAAVRAAVGAGAEENCVGAVLMVLMSEDSRVVILRYRYRYSDDIVTVDEGERQRVR